MDRDKLKELDYEFVPITESLMLKEIGYDKPCFSYYPNLVDKPCYIKNVNIINQGKDYLYVHSNGSRQKGISAPLYQQVFDFFLERYGLYAETTLWGDGMGYISVIKKVYQREFFEVYEKSIVDRSLPTWIHREERLNCIRKLIEIVKLE